MEMAITYKLNHNKLTGEWCRHLKGKLRRVAHKRLRMYLKKESSKEF